MFLHCEIANLLAMIVSLNNLLFEVRLEVCKGKALREALEQLKIPFGLAMTWLIYLRLSEGKVSI